MKAMPTQVALPTCLYINTNDIIICIGATNVNPKNCKKRCNCCVSLDIILTTCPVLVCARPAALMVNALLNNNVLTLVRINIPQ